MVKYLPASAGDTGSTLVGKIPEEEMATTVVFLPGKTHGPRSPGGLQSLRFPRAGHGLVTKQ